MSLNNACSLRTTVAVCSIVMPPRFSSLLHHEHDAHVFLFAPYAEFSRHVLRYHRATLAMANGRPISPHYVDSL